MTNEEKLGKRFGLWIQLSALFSHFARCVPPKPVSGRCGPDGGPRPVRPTSPAQPQAPAPPAWPFPTSAALNSATIHLGRKHPPFLCLLSHLRTAPACRRGLQRAHRQISTWAVAVAISVCRVYLNSALPIFWSGYRRPRCRSAAPAGAPCRSTQ